MNTVNRNAPGVPGIQPRWTSSAKDGVGTAYHTSSHLWFTLSHGIVNEVYYPHVDAPNTRDLQFLITDGETFCHEEKRDLDHQIEYPEHDALLYRLTNSDCNGRYRLVKEIIGEPHSSVLLMQTRLEILDEKLRGKLRLYALLAPHLKGTGENNSARWQDTEGRRFFQAEREDVRLVFGGAPDFMRRSVGYVGSSDGWQDLMGNFKMDWSYEQALDGNIALTGEIDLSQGLQFVIGVAFGRSAQSASTQLLQALATPFAQQRGKYVGQWQRTRSNDGLSAETGDGGHGTGVGRSWPILAGERGHYELAAGRDPKPFIAALEAFANTGGMLPEQLWDAKDLPERNLKFGGPTGSAMPLCWAHAEYLSLVRSSHDRVCFDRIEPVYQRYAKGKREGKMEMWTFAHQPAEMREGGGLRLIIEQSAKIHWSVDGWATTGDLETNACGLGMHWADLPTSKLPAGAKVIFTFHWAEANRWEGRNFLVAVAGTSRSSL